jgi:DinB superfamily
MDRPDIRAEALAILDSQDAHMSFDEAVAGFPESALNIRPPNVGYTPWHLLEHLRITQWDILEYIRNRRHVSPPWPVGYWPASGSLATVESFSATVEAFRADQAALRALVADPRTDLLAVLPGTPGHTILREVRVVADHNAYHLGEFAILRQVMSTWPADRSG